MTEDAAASPHKHLILKPLSSYNQPRTFPSKLNPLSSEEHIKPQHAEWKVILSEKLAEGK